MTCGPPQWNCFCQLSLKAIFVRNHKNLFPMRSLLALIFIVSVFGAEAQKYKDPRQYYRQFANENRKIKRKNLMFFEASLKGEDERRVAKYREMVIEQLRESKKEVDRVGPYEDYEILQREYSDALELYIKAFDEELGEAWALKDSMYNSWDDLTSYYKALDKAEQDMLDAAYKIERAEEHFTHKYYVDRMVDEETELTYQRLDEITPHVRDMSVAFYRVHMQVENFLKAIDEKKRDTLPRMVTEIRKTIRTSEEEVSEWADFEEDDLYDETVSYLQDMNEEIDETMRPLAEAFSNEYLGEDEYEDAQDLLERFRDWYNDLVTDWKETKMELIEDYLPED